MANALQNDFSTLVRQRRSVRRFKVEPVDPQLIQEAMEDVRFSPTPTNRQCYRFLGLSDPLLLKVLRQDVLDRIGQISKGLDDDAARSFKEYANWFTFFDQAPMVLFGLYRQFASRLPSGDSGRQLDGLAESQAFGGALHALLLALQARGLSSCWMSGPLIAAEQLEARLKIDPPWRLGAVIPVGHPEGTVNCPKKPDRDAIFSWFKPDQG